VKTAIIIGEYVEFKYCECGCQKSLSKYDKRGRERKFINGHYWTGKKLTEEHRKNVGKNLKGLMAGEKNPMYGRRGEKHPMYGMRGELAPSWKGNNIGIDALHIRVRKRLPKPEFCDICKERPPRDLANITGIYNDELKNWGWFCPKCHKAYDNIAVRAWITKKNKKKVTNMSLDSYLKFSEIN
jgi:hypothetical protein